MMIILDYELQIVSRKCLQHKKCPKRSNLEFPYKASNRKIKVLENNIQANLNIIVESNFDI